MIQGWQNERIVPTSVTLGRPFPPHSNIQPPSAGFSALLIVGGGCPSIFFETVASVAMPGKTKKAAAPGCRRAPVPGPPWAAAAAAAAAAAVPAAVPAAPAPPRPRPAPLHRSTLETSHKRVYLIWGFGTPNEWCPLGFSLKETKYQKRKRTSTNLGLASPSGFG